MNRSYLEVRYTYPTTFETVQCFLPVYVVNKFCFDIIHVSTQRNLPYNVEAHPRKLSGEPHDLDVTETEREEILF